MCGAFPVNDAAAQGWGRLPRTGTRRSVASRARWDRDRRAERTPMNDLRAPGDRWAGADITVDTRKEAASRSAAG